METGNLILSRRANEVVVISNPETGVVVRVTILAYDRGQVKISFDAPKYVNVDRLEVYNKKMMT